MLEFLSDPRATEPDGEWAAAARAWKDARIRKVVRRARGAAWERARALPGITVGSGTAEVRVYPPVPVDDWPAELARLQVSGTDFDGPDAAGCRAGRGAGAVAEPGAADDGRKGHGAGRPRCAAGVVGAGTTDRSKWKESNLTFGCGRPESSQWEELLASGLPVVTDGGFTEVAPGSARWWRTIRRCGRQCDA